MTKLVIRALLSSSNCIFHIQFHNDLHPVAGMQFIGLALRTAG